MFPVLLLVLIQVVFSCGSSGRDWNWRDYSSCEERRAWRDVYRKYGITDDVSKYVVPKTYLQIQYGDIDASPGVMISPLKLLSAPELSWDCDPDEYYTVLMINVDAISTNQGNELVIWRVEGISNCDVRTGHTMTRYRPPSPISGTGPRRIFVMVFEFDSYEYPGLLGTVITGTAGSLDFDADGFIKEHGKPWAGNFFRTKNEILGDVNLLPGASSLPLGGVTSILSKTESVVGGLKII